MPRGRAGDELDHHLGRAVGNRAELAADRVGRLALGEGAAGRLAARLDRLALGGFARAASLDRPLVEKRRAPVDKHAVDVLLGPLTHSTSLQRSTLAARGRLTACVWLSIAASSRSMRSIL
jgi:hypothetical protein